MGSWTQRSRANVTWTGGKWLTGRDANRGMRRAVKSFAAGQSWARCFHQNCRRIRIKIKRQRHGRARERQDEPNGKRRHWFEGPMPLLFVICLSARMRHHS